MKNMKLALLSIFALSAHMHAEETNTTSEEKTTDKAETVTLEEAVYNDAAKMYANIAIKNIAYLKEGYNPELHEIIKDDFATIKKSCEEIKELKKRGLITAETEYNLANETIRKELAFARNVIFASNNFEIGKMFLDVFAACAVTKPAEKEANNK